MAAAGSTCVQQSDHHIKTSLEGYSTAWGGGGWSSRASEEPTNRAFQDVFPFVNRDLWNEDCSLGGG